MRGVFDGVAGGLHVASEAFGRVAGRNRKGCQQAKAERDFFNVDGHLFLLSKKQGNTQTACPVFRFIQYIKLVIGARCAAVGRRLRGGGGLAGRAVVLAGLVVAAGHVMPVFFHAVPGAAASGQRQRANGQQAKAHHEFLEVDHR